ncbi:unnamed protein product [Adineta ricciae]|uniref:Uncharacterized protein n=1 Tax=Adineta ricciae TaxID=249248 RepID=A0A815QYG2_ADIRI|nr:unnamed protein product [Adineta ricciae]
MEAHYCLTQAKSILYAILYSYLLNSAQIADIFTALAYYNQIRLPLANFLPKAIERLSDIRIAGKRFDKFMRLGTVRKQETISMAHPDREIQHKGAILMRDASFAWHDHNTCLSSLNINIKPGTLVGITGPVGSGKSSFLAAILGELTLINGHANVNGSSFSYASQSSWILPDTLRANILFGKPFDERRYSNVLQGCCLDVDLSLLGPCGDLIIIGEKGINLSGGQKARISLARALYVDADIYLLDDPLAAVDSRVAQKIYDQCIGSDGLLSKKTRLLVTHQTQFLINSQQIICLSHGHIQASNRLNELNFKPESVSQVDDTSNKTDPISVSMLDINKQWTTDTQSIITDETSASKLSSWSVWCRLFAGSPLKWFGVILLVALLVFGEIIYDAANLWLCLYPSYVAHHRLSEFLPIFLVLALGTLIVSILRSNYFFYLILNGSNNLHNSMLNGLLYTSMHFFESNPTGRILNRASKDQQVTDELLPITLFDGLQALLMTVGLMITISFINPWILLLLIILMPAFILLCYYYLRTSLQIKRLESVTRSPIYTLFASTLSGLTTIRSFKVENDFTQLFVGKINANTRAYMTMLGASHWFASRLDFMSVLFLLVTAVLSVTFRKILIPSGVAISLMYCMQMTTSFQWSIRQLMEAANCTTSAERIDEYAQLPPEEDESDRKQLIETPEDWPSRGAIDYRNYSLRYRPYLEPVLKNINVYIESNKKIGIIGRTGAGKSSFLQSLFRLVNRSCVNGEILIDDIDISRVALSHLRSKLSVIPQQPVLFSGTLRYNLDPCSQYSDEQCWMSLEAVQLKPMVSNHPAGLGLSIAVGGTNLSAGQCQLICVARAILKQSRILLVDEATANVDLRTEALLQAAIANQLQDRTILTIAHRLHTVLKSDYLIVLDKGTIVRIGVPDDILPYYQFQSKVNHARRSLVLRKKRGVLAYPQCLRGSNRALSDSTIDDVVKFYREVGISRTSFNSKGTIKINEESVAVRFLEMTVLDAYQIFNERHPGAVSRSTFNALRAREAWNDHYRKHSGVISTLASKKINMKDLINQIVCTDSNEKCFNGQCRDCSNKNIIDVPTGDSMMGLDDECSWTLWKKVNNNDEASANFKNNFSIFNLTHHKTNFGLYACWTFIATAHGKSAGNGVGAVLKSTVRHATLSKNILMSNANDFFEFSQRQQLETARRSNKDTPGVRVFYLESDEVEEVKKNCLKIRSEKLRLAGTIQGIRSTHEFKPISRSTIQYSVTSRSTQTKTFTFQYNSFYFSFINQRFYNQS